MTDRQKLIISAAFAVVIIAAWAIYLVTKPDYACEAIKGYPGGEEALLKRLEDSAGKTPQDAAAAAQLARAMREDDAKHPDRHRC